jgi:hypothetical protein
VWMHPEIEHRFVEVFGVLLWGEVAHIRQNNQFCVRDGCSEILGVSVSNKLVMITV